MRGFLAITKALSDEARVRALMTLANGELCVCQIIEVVGLSPSTVSKHMSILQQAGLVERRKDGRWHYYRLAGRDAAPTVRQALRWARKSLQDERTIAKDARVLSRVRAKTREDVAACYNPG